MKSSYFNIGGYEFSLFEIENCVLSKGCKTIYGDSVSFNDGDIRTKFTVDEFEKIYNYGVSIPTK
jgi:hypothetical protein